MIGSFAQEAVAFMQLRSMRVVVDDVMIKATKRVEAAPAFWRMSFGVKYTELWKRPDKKQLHELQHVAEDLSTVILSGKAGNFQNLSVCFNHPRSGIVFNMESRSSN